MEIVRLDPERLAEASTVLARAFQDDPAWVWLIRDAERRRRLLPWLFRVGFDVTAADVWANAGAILGAARWLPPGRPPMRVGPTLKALVTTPFRLGPAIAPFLAYGRSVEALRAEAVPRPHWYLAGIGVDPSAQRRGIGGALLEPGLTAAARAGLPAALLTNSEANLPFYERHGFRVVREGDTPRGGPHAWAMVKGP
ncbi:MAG: GNAT family N-acetyltransferase [Gaiellaceae bacterium]